MKKTTFEKVEMMILAHAPNRSLVSESNLLDINEIHPYDWVGIMFIDVVEKFKVKVPLEKWVNQTKEGVVDRDYYFSVKNFCDHIDRLVVESKQ